MIGLSKTTRLNAPSERTPAVTAATIDIKHRSSADSPNLYAEHIKCIWLADELENAINERQSKAAIKEIVWRVYIAVEKHFRHEEQLFVQYGYVDGLRHSELHSTLLARFQQLSNELDTAVHAEVWIKCGSIIARMLAEHLKEEQVIYGI